MRVLIADRLPDSSLAALRAAGCELDVQPDATPDTLAELAARCEVLVVRSTKVPEAVLDAAPSLRLIVRAGAGYSNIDVKAASDRAIFVANCPGKNAVAVAELTIGLIVALDRRIPHANSEIAAGTWNKKEYAKAMGLKGRTLGVVGVGDIGRAVIVRARALGMKVIGWSRSLTTEDAEELGIERVGSLLDLAARSAVVTVHLPLNDSTRGLLGAEFLAELPQHAMLVNTSRGGVVDEAAVLQALDSRGLRYAADVFANEPGASVAPFETDLAAHPSVVCTPHIGASTEQAQEAVAAEAARVIRAFRETGAVPNCVNRCERSSAGWQLTVRHHNRVGVLASVLALVRDAHINVEELENIIFTGESAACAHIRLSGEPSDEVVTAIRQNENVLDAQVMRL